jgi:hypothetical protein
MRLPFCRRELAIDQQANRSQNAEIIYKIDSQNQEGGES